MTHGRFRAENGWVRGMIAWANNVLPVQVKGGPDWIDGQLYFIDARAADPEASPEQIRQMLDTLLKDRFGLTVHREKQQGQLYTLTVGKNGHRLQDAGGGQRNYINFTGPGKVTFTENSTLLGLVNILANTLGAPVVDQTGLTGSWNFSLEYTDPRDPRPRQADSPPDLVTAVQEQLGLRLQSAEGPVEVVVVDRIDKPSAN